MAVEMNEVSFEKEIIQYSGVALVDFWAPWCGPCKMIASVIEELSKDYQGKAKVCKVNVDDNATVASRFSIASIPTLLIFKGGNVVSQVIGFVSKAELEKRLDKALS